MLSAQYLTHASFLIKYGNITLLTDPWLSKSGTFLASWFQFPRFDHVDLAEAKKANYLYISHEHQDHFDPAFLATYNKSVIILLADFKNNRLKNAIHALGFQNIVTLADEDEYLLTENCTARIIKSDNPFWDDSALLISTPDGSIFNSNDLKCSVEQTERVKQYTAGGPTLHCLQFSGATWHPLAYENYSPEEKKEKAQYHINNKFHYAITTASRAGAKYIVPCAGPPCFLDESLFHCNFDSGSVFPTQLDFQHFVDERYPTQRLLQLLPGNTVCLVKGEVQNKPDNAAELKKIYSEKKSYLEQYQRDRNDEIYRASTEIEPAYPNLFERFQAYMQPLISVSPLFRHKINMRILFDIQGSFGGQWVVDFMREKNSVYAYNNEHYAYRFTFEDKYLELLISKKIEWEDFFLSLRCKIFRNPDIYNEYLIALLKFSNMRDIKRLEQFYLKQKITEFIVVEYEGKKYQVQKYCPHAGENLECAKLSGKILTCARHGWRFNVETGECLDGSVTLATQLLTAESSR